jgi:hypothetical protein
MTTPNSNKLAAGCIFRKEPQSLLREASHVNVDQVWLVPVRPLASTDWKACTRRLDRFSSLPERQISVTREARILKSKGRPLFAKSRPILVVPFESQQVLVFEGPVADYIFPPGILSCDRRKALQLSAAESALGLIGTRYGKTLRNILVAKILAKQPSHRLRRLFCGTERDIPRVLGDSTGVQVSGRLLQLSANRSVPTAGTVALLANLATRTRSRNGFV